MKILYLNNEYIDNINNEGQWMGEFEIIAISNIYNVNIYVFQINNKDEMYFINKMEILIIPIRIY